MYPCLFKSEFGFECLGCGFQRSIYNLFNGQILEAIRLYPAIIPIMITFVTFGGYVAFKFESGPRLLKYLLFIDLATVIISYIFKMLL